MHVCMQVHYVCMYVYKYVYLCQNMSIYMTVYKYICMHEYMYVCMYVCFGCVYTRVHASEISTKQQATSQIMSYKFRSTQHISCYSLPVISDQMDPYVTPVKE